jgi:AcrR family transcriptional regulator
MGRQRKGWERTMENDDRETRDESGSTGPAGAEAEKKTRTPRQKRSINTKQQIVEAAMKLFSEKGYHHTNTKEIAALAGVATGSFYSYFKDKREVFIEALHTYQIKFNGLVIDYLERTMAEQGDPRKMMEGLIRVLVQAHDFFKGFHNDLLVMRLEDPEIDRMLREEEKRDIEMTRSRIAQWQAELRVSDINTASLIVFAATHRIVDMISLGKTDIPADRLIEETADMVIRYLYG